VVAVAFSFGGGFGAAGCQGFLQQGIEGGSRQPVACQLQEGSSQRLTSCCPQGGVVVAKLQLVID
jgi:hypothetical protein